MGIITERNNIIHNISILVMNLFPFFGTARARIRTKSTIQPLSISQMSLLGTCSFTTVTKMTPEGPVLLCVFKEKYPYSKTGGRGNFAGGSNHCKY